MGFVMLAWEWPLGFLAGSGFHRSLEIRLAILPLATLASILLYQGTNAAMYYLAAMIIYFWAYSEGEVSTQSVMPGGGTRKLTRPRSSAPSRGRCRKEAPDSPPARSRTTCPASQTDTYQPLSPCSSSAPGRPYINRRPRDLALLLDGIAFVFTIMTIFFKHQKMQHQPTRRRNASDDLVEPARACGLRQHGPRSRGAGTGERRMGSGAAGLEGVAGPMHGGCRPTKLYRHTRQPGQRGGQEGEAGRGRPERKSSVAARGSRNWVLSLSVSVAGELRRAALGGRNAAATQRQGRHVSSINSAAWQGKRRGLVFPEIQRNSMNQRAPTECPLTYHRVPFSLPREIGGLCYGE